MPEHHIKERKPTNVEKSPVQNDPIQEFSEPYVLHLQRTLGNQKTLEIINRAKSSQDTDFVARRASNKSGISPSSPVEISKHNRRMLQRIAIPYNTPGGAGNIDTNNKSRAVSLIQSLLVEKNLAAVRQIYQALNIHVSGGGAGGVPVTANDNDLLDWLRPIKTSIDHIDQQQSIIDNLTPGKIRTTINDVSKRVFLVGGSLAASTLALQLKDLTTWFTTPPQVNIVFGSLTLSGAPTNQSFYTSGQPFHLNVTDVENNRTFEASGMLPPQTGHITGDASSANITQTPIAVPQDTQNMISFGFVASTFFSLSMLTGAAGYWLTKPSQSTIDEITKTKKEIDRLWSFIDGLSIKGPN